MLPVDSLEIVKFKRFDNFKITFDRPVTVISGANGTGKSSVLHLVSNSFQRPGEKHGASFEQRKLLSDMPGILNVKIEKLARGDKNKNDPAAGRRGSIYYAAGRSFERLAFRRHQTSGSQTKVSRYYLKPTYSKEGVNGLPVGAVVYLGLSRLLPQGEFDDNRLKTSSHALNQSSIEALSKNYQALTMMEIELSRAESLDGLKRRLEFSTSVEGIDSNTISAGQDNVSVILSALEHLAALGQVEDGGVLDSILLIDEFDATLHPDLQVRLLQLLVEYSKRYSIQIILTTQSMDVIEYAHRAKQDIGLIYLMRQGAKTMAHPDPAPHAIRMLLNNHTVDQLGGYESQVVNVFTEDDEARLFLRQILDFCSKIVPGFVQASGRMNIVEVNMGSDQLKQLFKTRTTKDVFSSSICVLDGDAGTPEGMDKKYMITCLPGGRRPESVLYDYARSMVESDADQFADMQWIKQGYTTELVERVLRDLQDSLDKISAGERSVRERVIYKQRFNDNIGLFEFVALAWCRDNNNGAQLERFLKDFGRVYSRAQNAVGGEVVNWDDLMNSLRDALSTGMPNT